VTAAEPDTIVLRGVARDFSSSHADFDVVPDAGSYYRPATVRVNVDAATHDPYGPFAQPVDANVSDDPAVTGSVLPGSNPRSAVVPGTYPAGSVVTVTGQSWKKVDESYSGLSNSHWTERWSATTDGPRMFSVRDGDPVPTIPAAGGQQSIEEYLDHLVDPTTHTMVLAPNQVIYLYEIGADNPSGGDFQDLIVLVTLATTAEYFDSHDSMLGEDSTTSTVPSGYEVLDQWEDSAGNPIAPHLYTASGTDAAGNPIADVAGTAGAADSGGITSADTFRQWFADAPGTNQSAAHAITLTNDGSGVYTYETDAFHPVDGRLLGNEGAAHNRHFTYAIAADFQYDLGAGQFIEFSGGDGAWLFINGQLAIDLGGMAADQLQHVALDRLGLADGATFTMELFYAQRTSADSAFRLRTNLGVTPQGGPLTLSGMFD
jgi:fibro-slime domain-containing protein